MLFVSLFEANFTDKRFKNDQEKRNYNLCCFHDHESCLVGSCLGRYSRALGSVAFIALMIDFFTVSSSTISVAQVSISSADRSPFIIDPMAGLSRNAFAISGGTPTGGAPKIRSPFAFGNFVLASKAICPPRLCPTTIGLSIPS